MEKAEKVERYYSEEHHFSEGIAKLRALVLKTGLEETYKWMFPTYTLEGKNVISICKFKKHFGIWFFNGVFLKDTKQVLENAQEGKTQAMRHWKFYTIEDIDKTAVLGYMQEAIENQKNGRIFVPIKKKIEKRPVPKLLKDALAKNANAAEAFKKLSLYNQNEYSEYIEKAKQEKTKLSRLEKILPMIIEVKGLNDKYR
ncbi:YdeI/OmpD-associated family protein [Maribacter sp. 2308TA10-17]|uniref:YdeI/OmpD-associated family protein n=1 Tax=Maribacter sp. 2308TA10-17 TaxID=3386276 RepID=UPI0039BD9307